LIVGGRWSQIAILGVFVAVAQPITNYYWEVATRSSSITITCKYYAAGSFIADDRSSGHA